MSSTTIPVPAERSTSSLLHINKRRRIFAHTRQRPTTISSNVNNVCSIKYRIGGLLCLIVNAKFCSFFSFKFCHTMCQSTGRQHQYVRATNIRAHTHTHIGSVAVDHIYAVLGGLLSCALRCSADAQLIRLKAILECIRRHLVKERHRKNALGAQECPDGMQVLNIVCAIWYCASFHVLQCVKHSYPTHSSPSMQP